MSHVLLLLSRSTMGGEDSVHATLSPALSSPEDPAYPPAKEGTGRTLAIGSRGSTLDGGLVTPTTPVSPRPFLGSFSSFRPLQTLAGPSSAARDASRIGADGARPAGLVALNLDLGSLRLADGLRRPVAS
jgi:hypothetical protein